MKTRTSLPLMFALSFLIISASSGNAQTNLHPTYMEVSLDSTFITYNMNEKTVPQHTLRGFVTSTGFVGSFTVSQKSAIQWVISTKINGNVVHDGDIIGIGQNQMLPLEVIVVPYADRPDTESYCIYVSDGSTILGGNCVTLALTNSTSAVSPQMPIPEVTIAPNPAGSYIFVRGLRNAQAGYRYEIFSMSGAEILHGTLSDDARINVQNLPSGAYQLHLLDAKQTLINSAFTILH